MFRYHVLCIGSATVDYFLTIEQPFKKIHMGDKLLVKKIDKHTGGGATNAAVALTKLGIKTKILTKLGKDHDAEFIEKELNLHKIKNICSHKSSKATDFATIISSTKEKDRVILVHKGASQDLTSGDYTKHQLKANWIYLASLTGKAFRTAQQIALYAKKRKTNILFNPSHYLAKKGKKTLKQVLQATTLLVLNKQEAQALLNTKETNSKKLLLSLHHLGPETAIVTEGSKRLFALHQKEIYTLIPPKVKIIHTAGAGDAFTAGVLKGILAKKEFSDALRIGQLNSSSVIQAIGTKSGLLTKAQLDKKMKKTKIIVKRHPL